MVLVLQQIGLQCEILSPEGQRTTSFTTPHCVLQRIVQYDVKDIPTLSTMRHVAFICGNIARYFAHFLYIFFFTCFDFSAISAVPHQCFEDLVFFCCQFFSVSFTFPFYFYFQNEA